jgi:hypothetical protein
MIRTRVQIKIDQPPAVVFEFVTDPTKATLWQSAVAEVEAPPGLPAGSKGRVVTQVLGQRVTSRFQVLDNDGRSYYRAISTQGPVEFQNVTRVERWGEGSKVTIETRIDAGMVFRLAETALESIAHTRFEADLHTLKTILETTLQDASLS